MEILRKSLSLKEKNQKVKFFVNSLLKKDDLSDLFSDTDDPFSLSKIGKTCLLQWNTILEKYEGILKAESHEHFHNLFQVKGFEASLKSRLILLFKILIYIMRNTHNHELYIIDSTHANFLYSSDTDISFYSFLFHNEFYNNFTHPHNTMTIRYFNSLDLSYFTEKKYEISSDFENDIIDISFTYKEKCITDFQNEGQKNIQNNVFDAPLPVLSELYSKYSNGLLLCSQIFRYEFYKNSESQKLLSIEILANLLYLKIHSKVQLEIILYSVYFFCTNLLEDCFLDSLSILSTNIFLIAKYHIETEETVFLRNVIEHISLKLDSCSIILKNEIYSWLKTRFYILLNFLNKDFIKKQKPTNLFLEMDSKNIFMYICYILYDQSIFIDFMNGFISNNTSQILNDFYFKIFHEDTNYEIKEVFGVYCRNHEDYNEYKLLFYQIFAKIIIYFVENPHLNEHNGIIYPFCEYFYRFTENISLYNSTSIDHVCKITLAIFSHSGNNKVLFYKFPILKNILKYYFYQSKNDTTVFFIHNIIYLIRLNANYYLFYNDSLFLENFIDVWFKNAELSVYLLLFPLEKYMMLTYIQIYLNNQKIYIFNLDLLLCHLNDMNTLSNVDMNVFLNFKKLSVPFSFTSKYFDFLKSINEYNIVETCSCYDFHYKHVLELSEMILNSVYLKIKYETEIDIYSAIQIEDYHYYCTDVSFLMKINYLILKKLASNLSEKFLISESIHRFISNIEIGILLDLVSLDKTNPNYYKKISKSFVFLKHLEENIEHVYSIEQHISRYECIKRIIGIVTLIYKRMFLSIKLPIISISSDEINIMDLDSKLNVLNNSDMDIISFIFEQNYVLILKLLLRFQKFPRIIPPKDCNKSIGFIYFIHKISSDMVTSDPNLISIYFRYINQNIGILYEYEYTELINLLQILINHSVKYYSTYQIDLQSVKNKVLKILRSLVNRINIFNETKIYEFIDLTFEFLEENISLLSLEDFLLFLNELSFSSEKIEKIISELKLFSKILVLIAKFDNHYVKDLNNTVNIIENPFLHPFLNDSFLNLNFTDFFKEAQKDQDSIFFFICEHINLIEDPKVYFDKNASKIDKYLKILRYNIVTNINNNKSMEYKKSSLFLPNLNVDYKEESDVFIYLISLVRLSNYSNIISKSEIYTYFDISKVLEFLKITCKKNPENKDLILDCAYTYLISLFEDELYLVSSFIYVIHFYDHLPSNITEYFNQKFIYTPKIQKKDSIYSNPIKDDDIKLKATILHDIINILKQEVYFYKIFALQFLSELIATFPSLLNIIKNDIHKDFINRLEFTYLLGIEFNRSNCSEWDLCFRFGYFITVSLYRGSLNYAKEMIEKICSVLNESNQHRSINIISLIYKILASEICCCKYIQYLNIINPKFYDKNCKTNCEKRKNEIFKIFLSNNILNILLLKGKEIYNEEIFRSNYINVLMDLWDAFFEYSKNGKIKIDKKYLICCLFQFYVPNSSDILFPKCLIKYKNLKIGSIKISSKSEFQTFEKLNLKRLSKIKTVDFGYILKCDHEIWNSRDYECIKFFDPKLKSSNNFYAVNINGIETIAIDFKSKSFQNKQIIDCLKRKLKLYDLPEEVYKVINSKLFLKEATLDINIGCDHHNNIFNLDNIMSDIYANVLLNTNLVDKKEYFEPQLSIVEGNFDENVVLKGLIFLCIFSKPEDFIEMIEIIKKILDTYSNLECLERYIESIAHEIEDSKLNEGNEMYFGKLEGFKKIATFFMSNKYFIKEDLLFELLFLELFFFDENERYFSGIFFKFSEITHEFLNWMKYIKQSKRQNIVFEILNTQNKISKCVLGDLLNIFSVYLEKMRFYLISKYFYSNLNSSDPEIKHFYKEADNFFSLLNQINFIEKYDKSEIIFKFFDTIRKNPLIPYFINSLDIENEIFIYLFDIYIKIIEKCCQIYFIIRQRVFNFKKLENYKKYFISEDFICFLFEIDHFESKFRNLNEKNIAKIDNLISFFYRIKNIFSNFDKIFFNFRCLSLKTKLLLIPKPDRDQNLLFDSYVFLQIDRNNIIESTIDAFKNFSNEIFSQKNWFVKYSNEEGSGIGLLYEFFNIFGKCIDESDYFAPFKSLEFIIICVSSPEEQNKIEQLYYFTGVIMAKSIFMNSVMSFEFINSFYLYLLQEKFNIEDLKDIDFEYYKNLISLRNVENHDPDLTFDISVKIGQKIISRNLIENGSEIKVTKDNLEDYIQKMAEFKMFKGMEVYLDKLKEGFQSLFNHCFYNMFTHSDLKIVIEGEKRININEWKAATRYRGKYYTDHQLIVWFWNFLRKSDEITKRKLLFFTTGLSYLPIGGFKSSKFIDHPFTITSDDRKDLFPRSQTCSNLLILPLYDQEDVLLDKIEHAIEVINYGFM